VTVLENYKRSILNSECLKKFRTSCLILEILISSIREKDFPLLNNISITIKNKVSVKISS